jgi:PAS domain S-box-containing protein
MFTRGCNNRFRPANEGARGGDKVTRRKTPSRSIGRKPDSNGLEQDRLRMALNAARAGVFEIDFDACSFWCSAKFETLLGRPMSFEEAASGPWPMVHPSDLPCEGFVERVDRDGGGPIEMRVLLPSGQARWVEIQVDVMRGPSGALSRIVGLVVDIDARKRRELAMGWMRREADESAERLSLALEAARAGVFEADFRNKTFWCSPEFVEIVGRPLTWAEASQPVWPIIHPDDQEAVLADVKVSLESLKVGPHEMRIRLPDGDWRWVDCRAVVHVDAEGRLSKIVGVLQDVDARKRQELALIEARAEAQKNADRLKVALNAGQAGVFETDFVNRTFWCSPEMVELLEHQLTFEEASGVWPMIHPDDVAEVQASIHSSQGRPEEARAEWRVRLPSGDYRWIEARALPRLGPDLRLEKLVGVVLDIDTRKRQELALLEAQRAAEAATEAKSQFLANMSHEIRTPMNGVLGVLHLLEKEPLTEDGQELLEEAQGCGQMLAQLLNDVIDFSRIEAGRLELSPEPLDVTDVLHSVVGMLRRQAIAKGLELRTSVAGEGARVMADPVRLRQALFNLIGNAVKFTNAGQVDVRMSLRDDGGGGKRIRFEVEDTGVGIPEEAQGRLFQRFHQADGSTARRFGGSGLGLAITRSLAEMMGGEVGFCSREGLGSTFWFDVPAPVAPCAEQAVAAPPSAGDAAPLGGMRILVVEDNPTNRLVACKMLESLGASVETAADGALGVEAAAAGGFDLVLMDVQMPHVDGVEATRRIRALAGEAAGTPIIGLTANVLAHQRSTYLAAGMDGVASKPISPPALLDEIARVLSGPRPAAAVG